jgi:hypothetical protein
MPDDEIPIKEKTEPFYLSKYFSFTHFHKLLSDCQTLIQVARFGYQDLQEKMYFTDEQIIHNRVDSLRNLFYILKDQLIKNCEPFMDEDNQKLIDAEEERIKELEKKFAEIEPHKDIIDQRVNLTVKELIQPFFDECLNELIDIQTKIKIPLNNMGFLFPKGSEFDIEEWEKRFKSGE